MSDWRQQNQRRRKEGREVGKKEGGNFVCEQGSLSLLSRQAGRRNGRCINKSRRSYCPAAVVKFVPFSVCCLFVVQNDNYERLVDIGNWIGGLPFTTSALGGGRGAERCTSGHIICFSKISLTITIDRWVERTGEFCLTGNLSYFLN